MFLRRSGAILGCMSAEQPLAGRHQRLLDWDEVELPDENADVAGTDAARSASADAKKAKEEPQSRLEKLRSILNRKIG